MLVLDTTYESIYMNRHACRRVEFFDCARQRITVLNRVFFSILVLIHRVQLEILDAYLVYAPCLEPLSQRRRVHIQSPKASD